jgi:ABC-type glycerol-3-phosphate transport system substrate-binding protein
MNVKRLSRREFLSLATLAGGGLVAAACAPAPAPSAPQVVEKQVTTVVEKTVEVPVTAVVEKVITATPPPKAPVTVKFQSGWWVGSATDTLTPVCAKFNEKYGPDIQVDLINLGTTPEDLLTAMAGGSANDVYHNYNFDATSLFARGVILPIDDLISANAANFDPSIYLKEQWEGSTYQGKRMAMPAFEGVAYPAFCWNEAMLQEIGADPTGDFDWPMMIDWAKKLNKFDAADNLTQMGLDTLDANGNFVESWAQFADTEYINPDRTKFLFDNPKFTTVMNYLAQPWWDAGVDKVAAFAQQWGYWTGGTNSGFANGVRAMILNGGWQPGELAKTQKDPSWKIGYTWVPTLTPKQKAIGFGGTHQLLIPKICKVPDEAFTLEVYCTSLEVAMMEYDIRGIACWSKPFSETADFSKYPGLDWFMAAPTQADSVWSPARTQTPIGGEVSNLWNRAVQETIYKTKPAEQALLDINAELQKSLDDFYAAQQS